MKCTTSVYLFDLQFNKYFIFDLDDLCEQSLIVPENRKMTWMDLVQCHGSARPNNTMS